MVGSKVEGLGQGRIALHRTHRLDRDSNRLKGQVVGKGSRAGFHPAIWTVSVRSRSRSCSKSSRAVWEVVAAVGGDEVEVGEEDGRGHMLRYENDIAFSKQVSAILWLTCQLVWYSMIKLRMLHDQPRPRGLMTRPR